ncbi:MAG: lycopene cyclase domain-containing protein [Cyclobacteriaceae bacterium]
MTWLYLAINVFTISFPLVRSFEKRIEYYKKWYALFPAIIITGTFFIVWDVIFTRNGVWGFNDDYLVGLRIFHLPIEEWLFFVTVPFASVFIYECLGYFFPNISNSKLLFPIIIVFGFLLMVLSIINRDQAYTFWCFLFTGIFLIFLSYFKPVWLMKFFISYIIHLVPFLLVNGILTGAFTKEPIVWYNDMENFGVRIFTIPIEDTIYALLLLLMNIALYELFQEKFKQTIKS